jgi:hypothetical protein
MTEIPSVAELKTKVEAVKSQKSKERSSHYTDLMNKLVQNYRDYQNKEWDQEKKEKHERLKQNLREGTENCVNNIVAHIIQKSEGPLVNDKNFFHITDIDRLKIDTKDVPLNVILHGFWNKEVTYFDKRLNKDVKGRHNRIPHWDAGVTKKPIEQVSEKLLSKGYKVTDVSDRSKSRKTFIRVEFI